MIRVMCQVTRRRGRSRVYLGDLQQYDAVLDGLYHALEGDGRGIQSQAGDTTRELLRGRRVGFSLTHVVSFKFSIFCEKKDRRKQAIKSKNVKKTEFYKRAERMQEYQQ